MATNHFPTDLDGRMRDQSGEIRQKRSDTHVESLRKTYGDDFAKGYRSDAHLGHDLQLPWLQHQKLSESACFAIAIVTDDDNFWPPVNDCWANSFCSLKTW